MSFEEIVVRLVSGSLGNSNFTFAEGDIRIRVDACITAAKMIHEKLQEEDNVEGLN
jgi:hypothetical protein